MFDFIKENIGTIIVCIILIVIVALIIMKLVRDKKNHKTSCGCSCSTCPGAQTCHPDKHNEDEES